MKECVHVKQRHEVSKEINLVETILNVISGTMSGAQVFPHKFSPFIFLETKTNCG